MKTIIWDFNGTIVDDTHLCLEIENKMLADRNMKGGYTLEEYRNLFCFPVIDYYRLLGYTFEKESYEDLSVVFNDLYNQGFPNLKLVPGVKEKLEEACEKGYQNVILSATRQSSLELEVQILGIENYFSELIGINDDLAFSKLEHAQKWFLQADIHPEECIYIGDTLHDLECANALGIANCKLVACGHQSYEVLKRNWNQVYHDLSEVVL